MAWSSWHGAHGVVPLGVDGHDPTQSHQVEEPSHHGAQSEEDDPSPTLPQPLQSVDDDGERDGVDGFEATGVEDDAAGAAEGLVHDGTQVRGTIGVQTSDEDDLTVRRTEGT
jgi:hypothetical protein